MKRFKLKFIGICFIFIMITPSLLPSISLSINQASNTQRMTDISTLNYISLFTTHKSKLSFPELFLNDNSPNPGIGDIQVKLLASIHQVGGLTARNCKIEWDGNIIYYNHPFEEEIVVNSQILTIRFSADIIYGPFPDPVSRTYSNMDVTNQTDFDELVYTTPLQDKLYFRLHFPAICFASDIGVYQNNQDVIEVDTNEPFKVNFSLVNLKSEIFQGNWTLYQKIGEQQVQSILNGTINMGEGIQSIEKEINLTGESIPSNTRLFYYVEVESDSFWQRTYEKFVMGNPTKPFVSLIELEWEEWYELGRLNYGEPYGIKVDIFNPTSNNYTDIVIINETLETIYQRTVFSDSITIGPNEHYIIHIEDQVINWETWKWFNESSGEIYNSSLKVKIHSNLGALDPKGLTLSNDIFVQFSKSELLVLLLLMLEYSSYLDDMNLIWGLLGIPICAGLGGYLWPLGIICAGAFFLKGWANSVHQSNLIPYLLYVYGEYIKEPPIETNDCPFHDILENLNMSEVPPELMKLYEYTDLLENYTNCLNSTYNALLNYTLGCLEENISKRMLYAKKMQNSTKISNQILSDIIEIQDEAMGTRYIWNRVQSRLEKNNLTYEWFLSSLTATEQDIKENETLRLEIIKKLEELGVDENQIQEILNISQTFKKVIGIEINFTEQILNLTQRYIKHKDEIIYKINLDADEIVRLSTSNFTSKVDIRQNYEASKRADINVIPSSISIEPGHTSQFIIEIKNLLNKTEPFNITIEDIPSEWEIKYQKEMNISRLTTMQIPINIFIPRNPNESPRIVPITIIILNIVVDFNSSVLVSVRPYHEIELNTAPVIQELKPEETASYNINVKNLGNVKDTFNIFLDGKISHSIIELKENQFILEPNELDLIELNITILENWASMENQTYNFTLNIISSDQVTKQSLDLRLMVIATPKSMMQYIISEILDLKVEINETLNGDIKDTLLCKLNKAIVRLNDSIIQYEGGNYSKAVILDKLAKINLVCSEIIVWVGDFICQIEDDFANYLISNLHVIRDHITLTMGKIIDTRLSRQIADIVIEILNIADGIYDYISVSLIDAILIDINLWQSAKCLDFALIKLTDGKINEIIDWIQVAICNLKQTEMMVSFLNCIGSINDEDAQNIKDLTQIQINKLNNLLINHYL